MGNRVKPRAYQAIATNGYRDQRGKTQISSGQIKESPRPDSWLTASAPIMKNTLRDMTG